MTPSKNRKRKNSCQESSADEPLKSRLEDEPPVLSRCPSPIEEEEVSCTVQSTFPLKPAHKGSTPLISSFARVDDDEYFAEPSFSFASKQRQSSSKKCQSLKNSEHCNLEPAKKRLKLEPEMAPPVLIKSSLGPLTQKISKAVTQKTARPSKSRKAFPLSRGQKHNATLKSVLTKKLSTTSENNVVDVNNGVMPEIEKTLSGDRPVCTLESQLVDIVELPRLNENISYQNLSLSGSEIISFTTDPDEDVLVAEECYADVEDPGVVPDKSINLQLPSEDPNQRVFFGIFKAYSISSPPSKKKVKDAEEVRHVGDGSLHASKKTKPGEFGKDILEASRSQRLSVNEDVSSMVVKETSAEELTAANALLDFKRSFCHGDGSPLTSATCSKKKNIFEEFKKLRTVPCDSKSTNANPCVRKNFTPVAAKASIPPSDLSKVETSPLNSSNVPQDSVPSLPSAAPLPQSRVPPSSCTSQVQFLPWSEKSPPDNEEPACPFSGNPEVDSAYSTSSSSSSLLISSSPSEERCNSVL